MKKLLLTLAIGFFPFISSLAANGTFKKVTDTSTLKAGDQIIVVANSTAAMGAQNGTYRSVVTVTQSDNITDPKDVAVVTLESSGNPDYPFYLNAKEDNGSNGYIGVTGKGNVTTKTEIPTDATSYSYQITAAGFKSAGRYSLQLNNSAKPQRFAGYAGTQINATPYILVTKTNIGLKYSDENAECDITKLAEFVAPVLSFGEGYENVPVVYSSENENVATVTADGKVNIRAKGTTVITAAVASDNANYEGSASYTLKVIDPNAPDPALINATELEGLKPDNNVTAQGYTFSVKTNSGSTAPTYSKTDKDYRIYAKGSLNIIAPEDLQIVNVVFAISSNGKKRLTSITASEGTIATQAKGDTQVSWSGNADNVTFTVGDKATYGTDGDTKAGQLCFDNVKITYIYKAKKPVVSHNKNQVTITHEEEGAKIYYTVDGSNVDVANATLYDAPFAIDKTTTVKAVAVVKGKANSAQNDYVAEYIAAPTATYTYEDDQSKDFTFDASSMSLNDITGGIRITITAPEGCALWYELEQTPQNDQHKPGNPIMKAAGNNVNGDVTAVSIDLNKVAEGVVKNVLVQTQGKLRFYSENAKGKQSHDVVVNFTGETGVEDIIADENNGEVEYFNLQGVRVANPENGVYIRRQGNKATKVLVK